MKLNSDGLGLIKKSEGFRHNSYLDTGGVWTIGFGTTRYPDGTAVREGESCSVEQAEYWLMNDVAWAEKCVDESVTRPINQKMFNALVSMAYNIGASAFARSTLVRKLNAGDFIGAQAEFDRWVLDNGKRIDGLVNRRNEEQALFNEGIREVLPSDLLASFDRLTGEA